jgi:hypothetical protein
MAVMIDDKRDRHIWQRQQTHPFMIETIVG